MSIIYQNDTLSEREYQKLLDYIESLDPVWEKRYSNSNPPPEGSENRGLLRPVYWLGNWQFACLDYYHPPKGIENRCVKAEAFPAILQNVVDRIETLVKNEFRPDDVPRSWTLNTCLINYYGDLIDGDKTTDVARVGEHKDFEPGPVASISFGERALFQFVASEGKRLPSRLVKNMWLDDNSLQIFGGETFKRKLFHRVQRVERKGPYTFAKHVESFRTRRINLTFRYVPKDHIVNFSRLPQNLKQDIDPYVQFLAQKSEFWKNQLSQ